ncbi:unnamed protein product [Cochlearia groenlandica]
MSQLLFRRSSLTNALIHKTARLFSTNPCMTLGIFGEENTGQGRGYKGDILWFDSANESLVAVKDKIIPEELISLKLMGASQGWQFFSDRTNHSSVCITDLFNPLASKSKIKIVPLPPFTTMNQGQTKVVSNVAMSSSSPHDDDEECCVVAIKFLGRQLSMCRPGLDLEWTNFSTPFLSSENSNLMYSKRDHRFNMLAPGGKYLCSWDLSFKNDPKFDELVFQTNPDLPHYAWELLNSYFREDYWVESPSGHSFLVKWYSHVPTLNCKDPLLLVFREDGVTKDGKRNMCYTEDIGDICIFISKSEPFCVAASSCPGLKPGSVYLMGSCFAVVDIINATVHHFDPTTKGGLEKFPFLPFWLPPLSV